MRRGLVLGALALAAVYLAWRVMAPGARSPLDDPALREELAALGYAEWAEIPGEGPPRRGVTRYDPLRSHPGFNLYRSAGQTGALLVDMRGGVVHRWLIAGSSDRWEHLEMTPQGELLVLVKHRTDPYIMSLDWDSHVRWKRPLGAHHDIAVTPNGEVHTLTRRVIEIPFEGHEIPLVDNAIATFSPPSGAVREVSLYELFGDQIPERRLAKVYARTRKLKNRIRLWLGGIGVKLVGIDLLHSNSIQILDRPVEGLGAAGDALISIRELDLIAVVDETRKRVVWSWGPGEVERPHHPTLLPDGKLLIFDNGSLRRYSRVIELDPRRRAITWQYVAEPRASFFSHEQGAAQKLPNGNVLITESMRGRVFEITRDGEVVWEFFNPNVDEKQRKRAEIYRMTRLETAFVDAIRSRAEASPRD